MQEPPGLRNVSGPGMLRQIGTEMRIARAIALAALVAALPASSFALEGYCLHCAQVETVPGCHPQQADDRPQLRADCFCCAALACAEDSQPSAEPGHSYLPAAKAPAVALAAKAPERAPRAATPRPSGIRPPLHPATVPLYVLHDVYLI